MEYRITGGKRILSAKSICLVLSANGFQLEIPEATTRRAHVRIWFAGGIEAENVLTIEEVEQAKRELGKELVEPWLTFPGQLLAITALRACAKQLEHRQPDLFTPGGIQ